MPETIRKIIIIVFSLGAMKFFFVLLPYLMSPVEFNEFNKMYYTAALAAVIGNFGLNYSFTIKRINISKLLFFIGINSAIIFFPISFIQNEYNIFSFIVCFAGIVFGISSFYLLYNGLMNEYMSIHLILGFGFVLVYILSYLKVNLIVSFAFTYLIVSLVSLYFVLLTDKRTYVANISVFYRIGLPAFVINSIIPFIFGIDKYIVSTFFYAELANAYIFAWYLTMPVFYIGVLLEKYIYTGKRKQFNTGKMKKELVLFVSALILYYVFVLLILNFGTGYLPSSINLAHLKSILNIMLPCFLSFTLFHYPLNAYLFKNELLKIQSKISNIYLFLLVLIVISFSVFTMIGFNNSYTLILGITWFFLAVLTFVKYIMLKVKRKFELNSYNNPEIYAAH